jgi:5,10-methenyltetrahydrofolate synthetase
MHELSLEQTKNAQRADVRDKYTHANLNRYVASALEQIEACATLRHAIAVLAYEPISSLEIPFVHRLMRMYPKKKWYLPEVVSEEEMLFVRVHQESQLYTLSKNTCVLVPSLALDAFGNRLGKGGGYYDRFLAQYPSLQSKSVAIVPDFARVDTIQTEAHDVVVAHTFFAAVSSC